MSEKLNYTDSWTKKDVLPAFTRGDAILNALQAAREELNSCLESSGPEVRKAAVANLEGSLQFFGTRGQQWMKNEEFTLDYNDGIIAACSIGAVGKLSGKGQYLARLCIDLAAGELFPDKTFANEDVDDTVCRDRACVAGHTDPDLEIWSATKPDVVNFNDHDDTTFPDVKKVFKHAIKLVKGFKKRKK